MRRILLSLAMAMALQLLVAQSQPEYFEGILHYQIELEGDQADFIRQNKPNDQMDLSVGEGNYLVQLSGGAYPKTLMFIADSNYEYSMDMRNARAFRFSPHFNLNRETHEQQPEAVPTGRKGRVAGYPCREYKIEKEDMVLYYYVNDDYRVDLSAFPEIPRSKAMFLVKGLQGRIPIRTIKRAKGLTVTTTLTGMEREDFDKENFMIPPNFKIRGRDYRY